MAEPATDQPYGAAGVLASHRAGPRAMLLSRPVIAPSTCREDVSTLVVIRVPQYCARIGPLASGRLVGPYERFGGVCGGTCATLFFKTHHCDDLSDARWSTSANVTAHATNMLKSYVARGRQPAS